jgi:hypothetical protein
MRRASRFFPGDMVKISTPRSENCLPVWNTWGDIADCHVGYFTNCEVGVVIQDVINKRSVGIKVLTSSGLMGWVSANYVIKVAANLRTKLSKIHH